MMYLGFSGFLACLILLLGVLNLIFYSRMMSRLNNLKEQSSLLFDLFYENNTVTPPDKIVSMGNNKNISNHPEKDG
ncbi:MAG TPA: hypothetical protein ENK06_11955 [Gammaproteobacteria bacterium]|nr:hypothetical protein [Gammaproteobacteria bacterium]